MDFLFGSHNEHTASASNQFRPTLEHLEDRVVPATFTVTNLLDDGSTGTLRWAIQQADNDANSDADEIVFDSSLFSGSMETIALNGSQLSLSDPSGTTTIRGPGHDLLTISGNNSSRVLNVGLNVAVTVTDVTIADGDGNNARGGGIRSAGHFTLERSVVQNNIAGTDDVGGGLYNNQGTMHVIDSIVRENSVLGAGFGGGVYSHGTLTITNSVLDDNTAQFGAGIYVTSGSATVIDSTVKNHGAGWGGGGLYTSGATTISVISSTFHDNTAGNFAGGLYASGGHTIDIINSTFFKNSAGKEGGAIWHGPGTLNALNSTFVSNRSDSDGSGGEIGGGLFGYDVSGTSTFFHNSIVAGNLTGKEEAATPNDLGGRGVLASSSHNLIGDVDSSGGLTHNANGNIVGNSGSGTLDINSVVETTLADNGGPTPTLALVGNSLAFNAGANSRIPPDSRDDDNDGNTTEPLPFDQRGQGFARVVNGVVDIGAFEVGASNPTIDSFVVPSVAEEGDTVSLSASATASSSGNLAFDWEVSGPGGFSRALSGTNPSFVPPDDGNYTVTLTVTETGGGSATDSATISVSDVALVVFPPNNQQATEGMSASIQLGEFTDPGDDDPWQVLVEWGDGTEDDLFTVNSAGSLGSLAHTFADNGSYTVKVTVTGEEATGASHFASFEVSVANVAPTVDTFVVPSTADEGETISLSASASDPAGVLDPLTYTWTVTGPNDFLQVLTGANLDFTPPDNGLFNVTLSVTDGDGGEAEQSGTITVANVAPTISTFDVPSTADEGEAITFSASASDPAGVLDPLVYTWTVTGPNGFSQVLTGTNLDFTPPDNGLFNVTLSGTDGDGGEATQSATITAANVAPTITSYQVPDTMTDGATVQFRATTTDPAGNQDPLSYSWQIAGPGGFSQTLQGENVNFTPTDQGSYVVTLTVSDGDGGEASQSSTITVVGNDGPAITSFDVPITANEGDSLTLSATAFDPNNDPLIYAWTITGPDGFSQTLQGASVSFVPPDNGTFQATLTVTDPAGASASQSGVILVGNVLADFANLSITPSVNEGGLATLSGQIVDPGTADTFSLVVDWGDGSTETFTYQAETTTFSETHLYLDDNPSGTSSDPYNVRLSLRDDDQGGSRTTRVSVASDGTEGNNRSRDSVISPNGRYVAFSSFATNLVAGDTNRVSDVFLYDRLTRSTKRISLMSQGRVSIDYHSPSFSQNGRFVTFMSSTRHYSFGHSSLFVYDLVQERTTRIRFPRSSSSQIRGVSDVSISNDGNIVVFDALYTNLVPNDDNRLREIFVHNRQRRTTEKVSVNTAEVPANAHSFSPSVSADGRYVVFGSFATNLEGPFKSQRIDDIYLRDRTRGTTQRVSVSFDGLQPNASSSSPSISANGRYVAFSSMATNLVQGDTNGQEDVFIRNRITGHTRRVSTGLAGEQANGDSFSPKISPNGRYVVFASAAENLVADDTNGRIDIFVYDVLESETIRRSSSFPTTLSSDFFADLAISDDGSISFGSSAHELVPDDLNNATDIFVISTGPDEAELTVTVNNLDPSIDSLNVPSTATEREPLTLSASVSDPARSLDPLNLTWTITDPTGASTTYTSEVVSFTPPRQGDYVVSLTVTDDDEGLTTATRTIQVEDANPDVALSLLAEQVFIYQGLGGNFSFSVSNSTGAWSAVVDYGDETVDTTSFSTIVPDTEYSFRHTYTTGGNYTIAVTLTGSDGTQRTERISLEVLAEGPAAFLDDQGNLVVLGTNSNDRIQVRTNPRENIIVRVGGTRLTNPDPNSGGVFDLSQTSGRVIIHGLDGNDNIVVRGSGAPSSSFINAEVYGGAGDDRIRGSEGNDLIDGGTGNDDLFGLSGHDLLIGGLGNDWLFGGDGNDVMIGQTLDLSVSDQAFYLSVWARGGTGSGVAGFFIAAKGDDDGESDSFWGGSGDDLFLTAELDRLRDLSDDDTVV